MDDEPAARRNFPQKKTEGLVLKPRHMQTTEATLAVSCRWPAPVENLATSSSVAGLHRSKLTSLLLNQHIIRSTKTCRFDKIRKRNYSFWKRGYQLSSHETKDH